MSASAVYILDLKGKVGVSYVLVLYNQIRIKGLPVQVILLKHTC